MSNLELLQQIKESIGENAFKIFVDLCRGRNIYVHKNYDEEFINLDTRNKYIRNLFHAGKSYDELAERFGLSKEHIRKITYNR